MGTIELFPHRTEIFLHATAVIYGAAARDSLAKAMQDDINDHWNEPRAIVTIDDINYVLIFKVECKYREDLQPEEIFLNDNPTVNYFRIEEFAIGNISYVDGLGCNTGYFKLQNLLNHSTTAAHEFGHTLGLEHPVELDIRGTGTPGIMYPRGTIVDPHYQYDINALPGQIGGTINPEFRKVLQADVDLLKIYKLDFDSENKAVLGDFSSIWHEAHQNPDLI